MLDFTYIPNYPNYAINSSGVILAFTQKKMGKPLKISIDKDGYSRVSLVNEFGRKNCINM